jgi:hypothetical protein
MPDALRELYGNENAHNYFAQQFAELGLVGGLLFAWLAFTLLAAGWSAVRGHAEEPSAVMVGLFAGVGAYLLTCVTGHPLLVPEAAFPFWIAAGALVATVDSPPTRSYGRVAAVLVVSVLLVSGVARAATVYARVSEPPPDHGFHIAPSDVASSQPLVVETALAGRIVDRRELPPRAWVTYDLPVNDAVDAPFRRIDLRTNQQWTQEVKLGRRAAQRPVAVMVGEIRWIPVEEVGRLGRP